MTKKLLVVGGAVGLLLVLLFGGSALSYVYTGLNELRETVKESVPVEFELQRAKNEISRLEPVIRDLHHEIAKQEVRVEKLDSQIASTERGMLDAKEDIMTLKTALSSGDSSFRFAGHTYTSNEVEEDLTKRFEHFKTQDETLEMRKKTLDAQQARLQAAYDQLKELTSAKTQLQVKVANLEAQHKMIEVAKTASEFNFDNSQLARTRELIEDIETRLDVESRMVDSASTYRPEIQLDEPSESRDISEEIAKYFEPDTSEYAGSSN